MPVARHQGASAIGTISSHLTVGVIPFASANTITAMKFMPRLKTAVSDTASGTTIRGKAHLAQQRLALDQARDAAPGRLGEVGPEHDPGEQIHPVVGYALAELKIWVKTT